MKIATATQIQAAVTAAQSAVTGLIAVDITRFISQVKFEAIITDIVTAALNADEPKPANQPLAP